MTGPCDVAGHTHVHRHCRADMTDQDRADEFLAFVRTLEELYDVDPERLRFLPKDGHDNKQLAHFSEGSGFIDTPDVKFYEFGVSAAYDAIRHGHPGFALYYGRKKWGTGDLGAIDDDNPATFPYGEGGLSEKPTRGVTGSGTGHHIPFINEGDVQNAVGAGEVDGEVRVNNLYTVVPGSTHPSGGVYALKDVNGGLSLSQDGLPESLQPSNPTLDERDAGPIETTPSDEIPAEFENRYGESLATWRERSDKLDRLLTYLNPGGYGGDTSEADMGAISLLKYFAFDDRDVKDIMRRYRSRRKVEERDDYLDRSIHNCQVTDSVEPPEERDFWGSRSDDYDPQWVGHMPETARTRCLKSGWDWLNTDPDIPKQEAYRRNEDELRDAMFSGDNCILGSMMASGKTYSSFKVAAEEGERLFYAAPRTDLYDQGKEFCREFGLSYLQLPAFHRDCDVMSTTRWPEMQQRADSLYRRGVTPDEIHERLDMPCQHGGHGCAYKSKMEFDPDEFDVLIGHYSHLHLPHLLAGRNVVIDEYPGEALMSEMSGEALEQTVNEFCSRNEDFPADSYNEVIARRGDPIWADHVEQWFKTENPNVERDVQGVFECESYHANTPKYVYTLACSECVDPNNPGYAYAKTSLPTEGGSMTAGVFVDGKARGQNEAHIQDTPGEWNLAKSVICLDGTPNVQMWEDAVNLKLSLRDPFPTIGEKRAWYRDTLGINVFRTANHPKSYSSGRWVTSEKDNALVSHVAQEYSAPVLVSTLKAINGTEKYDGYADHDEAFHENEGGPAKAIDHFGALRGSNKYAEENCAVITGSPHYGDEWVRLQAAFQGDAVYRDGKGSDLTYGDADDIAYQMKEAVMLQTILRFGRTENAGAAVFVHSDVIPDEIGVSGIGTIEKVWTKNQKAVFEACSDLARSDTRVTTANVHDHIEVACSRATVRNALNEFAERGLFRMSTRNGKERVYIGWDGEEHRVSEGGVMELPTLDVGDGDDEDRHTIVYMPVFGEVNARAGPNVEGAGAPTSEADGPPPTAD